MDAIKAKLTTTFVEQEDGSEQRVINDQTVLIYRPPGRVVGLTFLITAVSMPVSKYRSIIQALTETDHAVVGVYTNLNPNHREKAERIPAMFEELGPEFRVHKYDIVGHSIGGKIALLAAALYDADENKIRSIVALDPVDQTPAEFTNPGQLKRSLMSKPADGAAGGKANLSLEDTAAAITVTCTDTGYWIKKQHNGREIQRLNPKNVRLIMQRNSHHMVYCDDDGVLSWKSLAGKGSSPDRNKAVKDEALHIIRENAAKATLSGQSKARVTSLVGKAKKAVNDAKNDLTEIGNDAQKLGNEAKQKGNVMKGMASVRGLFG